MKALKFVRAANKVVWLVVLSVLNICVGYQWSKQGCGVESVIAAVLMFAVQTSRATRANKRPCRLGLWFCEVSRYRILVCRFTKI